jgi:predicted O-methyltransferase YrrM
MVNIDDFLERSNWFDYQQFYTYVSTLGYKTFVEIGVWKGHSISFLAKLLKDTDPLIYAVDLWEKTTDRAVKKIEEIPFIYKIYRKNLELAGVSHLINDIQADSSEAAQLFQNSSVDFVFIDASHDYNSVKRDIGAWLPKIKPGGMISGHDYNEISPGVIRAVEELFHGTHDVYQDGVWLVEIPKIIK